MPKIEKITTVPGLTFDALVAGARGSPLVLLLHGFAESMNCWRAQVAALAVAGELGANLNINCRPIRAEQKCHGRWANFNAAWGRVA